MAPAARPARLQRAAADLLSKLPADYNAVKVKQQIEKLGGPTPLNVLGSGGRPHAACAGSGAQDTQDLQLAIAGTIIMSAELQEAQLYDARVPPR